MLLDGKRIYMVEDNEDNIFVVLSLLRHHGASVQIDWWAKGEAHRVIKALPLDLIILDLMLPHDRSGYDVFEEIRAVPELQHVPVVAVSASDPSIAMPIAITMGFNGYISKPVGFDLFPKQIASLIAGEAVWYTV
ncbi:MAG: response regulator [Chloroflexi bacterium]|nr:response regulator [Chloroflexota bacterium]